MRHHAVWLTLDSEAERTVRSIWAELDDAGVSSRMLEISNPPHVTLGIFFEADVDGLTAAARSFAADQSPLELRFESAGSFGGDAGVVFLAPVVTPSLLDLHRAFHDGAAGVDAEPSPHYLPNNWVPHCTTGFNVPPDQMGRALTMTRACGLPFTARVTGLGIGTFDPEVDTTAEHLEAISLGTAGAAGEV